MTGRPAFKPVKPRAIGTPKAAVSELIAQAGGIERVMVKLGIGKTEAYACTDPQSDREISFARVAALTAPGCTAGVEYLAALAHGVFLPLAGDPSHVSTLTADALRKHGAAAADLVEALRDGRVTADEAREALPEVEAAARAMALLLVTLTEAAVGREVHPPD